MSARTISIFAGAVACAVAAACSSEDIDLDEALGHDAATESACPGPACGGPSVSCSARASCCSGLCEPGEGSGRRCLDYCKPLGATCDKADDCCSLGCSEQKRCTTMICLVVGAACVEDVDCCSSHCDNLACVPEETACRRTAERCASGSDCCSGVCDAQTQRCDVEPGACGPPLFPCSSDTDCCAGACVANGQGVPVCASSCFSAGAPCSGASDCCSGACSGNRCVPASCDP